MNKLLFPRLAWKNIRSNGKFYFPYILTISGVSAAFYITLALANAKDVPDSQRYEYLSSYMTIGVFVIALFSIIFLFYTNSFLMKRRNKELGLYNILGLGKAHLGRVLCWETIYTALIGIGGGIAVGVLLQRLVTLAALKMIGFEQAPYGFYISFFSIGITFLFFFCVLFLNLLFNLNRIRISNPTELLRENDAGERDPKTKWITAVAGIVTLGAGYFIALCTKSAVEAVSYYFIAVFLVIIGTYCLFTAGSIAVLKLLRKNKKYYYKTQHFISISGMLHRMRRNAVGLANICIISTMVLVMVSGTLALYVGTEDSLDIRCPADLTVEVSYDTDTASPFDSDAFTREVIGLISQEGFTPADSRGLKWLNFAAGDLGGIFSANTESVAIPCDLVFVTAADYAAFTGLPIPELSQDEVILYSPGKTVYKDIAIDFATKDNPNGEKFSFKVKDTLSEFPQISNYSSYIVTSFYFLVPDDATLISLYKQQLLAYGEYSNYLSWQGLFNITGSEADKQSFSPAIVEALENYQSNCGEWKRMIPATRARTADDVYSLNSGFFFLGIFLGIIFIMALVLIIYYKQITEGYEDRERFRIMEQVGLDKKTVRKSVNAQLRTVFFMPLLVAAVHIAFNFGLMILLLSLFQLYNATLTLICTLITFVLFVIIYGIVYLLTARTYYKIVS